MDGFGAGEGGVGGRYYPSKMAQLPPYWPQEHYSHLPPHASPSPTRHLRLHLGNHRIAHPRRPRQSGAPRPENRRFSNAVFRILRTGAPCATCAPCAPRLRTRDTTHRHFTPPGCWRRRGMVPVIPLKRSRKEPQSYDEVLYQARYLAENCFGQLKGWRGVATLYAKKAASYLASCQIRALSL